MKTVDPDILSILSGALIEGPVLKITQQLPRDVYVRVDKVLKDLGGRWDGRKAVRGHVFPRPAADVIDDVCLTGSYEKWTHGGFFETPADLAAHIVDLAKLSGPFSDHLTVLEPSAGRGALVQAAIRRGVNAHAIQCVELRPEHAAYLRERGYHVIERDFLTLEVNQFLLYHRVIMNPPFEQLADIRHVLRAYEWLEVGGRLVSVMSPGWTFRADQIAADFRTWISERHHTWELLPDGSFKTSGTGVRAGILAIEKE